MQTLPAVPTATVTEFATVWPATKFRLDANGNEPPHGYTVTNPVPSGRSAVTFNTTAVASNGTPPRPDTTNSRTEPATGFATSSRESHNRDGTTPPTHKPSPPRPPDPPPATTTD